MTRDLVLSSGFLAFGAHCGFLAGVEQTGAPVDGVCGTSSGALVGALWAAGLPAREIFDLLTARAPLGWASASAAPWRGLFTLDRVVAELRSRLPARIEALPRPFGVGVAGPRGHELMTSGPLPEAVAASCAIPWMFAAVALPSGPRWDGGALDRLGVDPWRQRRPHAPLLVHLVDRSRGAVGATDLSSALVVRSARSGARLWSLGDAEGAFTRSRAATVETLSKG